MNIMKRFPAIFASDVDQHPGQLVLRDRALKGLHDWRDRLRSIISMGIKRREVRRGVDSKELATLIISSFEGALMIARLERDREALVAARSIWKATWRPKYDSRPEIDYNLLFRWFVGLKGRCTGTRCTCVKRSRWSK